MSPGPAADLESEEQNALAFEETDRLVDALWADPVAAQADWDEELAAVYSAAMAAERLEARDRRARLDGAAGSASLRAAEEVLDGASALTTKQAADAAFRDTLGDALVSAFTAAHRVAGRALWVEVCATAQLLTARTGRTRSLPRRPRSARSGPVEWEDADSLVADEVAAELALAAGITVGMARSRVEAATALVVQDRLPATAALLSQGLLDWSRLAAVLGRTRELSPEAARAVETLLYASADLLGRGLTRFEHAADAALLAVDAEAFEARRRRLRRERRVGIHTARDGSAFFTATGPAEAVVAAFNGLDAAARQHRADGDARTLDQLRFDMFVTTSTSGYLPVPAGLLPLPAGCVPGPVDGAQTPEEEPCTTTARDDAGQGPTALPGSVDAAENSGEQERDARPWFSSHWPNVQVQVNVTLSADTLMGLTDSPGVLEGYGPIPAGAVRDLVTNGVFRCVVVDGVHGTVLGIGRSTFTPGYTPGARLKLLAEHAFPVCDVPGCEMAGRRCDLDHQISYAAGGSTCICNLRPLCRMHHRLKTAGLLVPVWTGPPADPGSELTWVTRTGRAYSTDDHVPLPRQRRRRTAPQQDRDSSATTTAVADDPPPY